MIKVLVACGCGMGSSQLLKMNCAKVLTGMGLEYEIEHTSVGEAKAMAHDFDVVIVADNFSSSFDSSGRAKIVCLKNIMNRRELQEKLESLQFD